MFYVYLTLFWLIGIWFSETAVAATLPNWAWVGAAFFAFVASYWLRKVEETSHLLLACLSLFCMGVMRARSAEIDLSPQHISRLNDAPRPVAIAGTVIAEPDVRDSVTNLRIQVESAAIISAQNPDGEWASAEGVVLVTALRYPEIAYGTQVTATGRLETPFESAEFSYKEFLAREGIHSTMYLPRVRVSAENQGNPLYTSLLQFKQRAVTTIARIVPAPESAVLQSMLFGDRTFLTDRMLENYRIAGLAHTIVVSGFHVSIILSLVLGFSQFVTTPRWALLVTTLVLILYAMMVGLKPSVIRAVIMSLAYLLGQVWLGRRTSSLAILGLLAFGMTAYDPTDLYDVSFQLSFAATLGIILYTEPISAAIQARVQQITSPDFVKGYARHLITIVAMTLSAQLLTLPLVAWHFEQISLISIISNLFTVPVLPISMTLGSAATFVGMAFEPLGEILGWLVWLPLRYMTGMLAVFARVPFAAVPVQISSFSVVTLYLLIGLISWYRSQPVTLRLEIWERVMVDVPERSLAGGSLAAMLLIFGWYNTQPDGMLHVTFFDVGQGDATLIETPSGNQILIDAGYSPSMISSRLGRAIPFWDRTIDLVIVTHPDADHVAGVPEVLARYEVGQLLVDGHHTDISEFYAAMLNAAETHSMMPTTLRAGEVIAIDDGVRLEIVHPGEVLDDETRNNNSVSMRLVYGAFSLLLTGDAEHSAENEILRRNLPLQSMVYKAGHHGSKTSSTPAFLDAVNPQIVVVSAGEGNRFGHPHPEVMERFAERGATVLCTNQFGSIEVVTDGQQMWWEAAKRPTKPEAPCVFEER